MTQANIDIGTGPSTGDGDPIRTAFNKVNENFTELYATINQQGITYVNVAGVSSSTGTGATFNITKYANDYAAVINQQGTGYGAGNVITVWGNVLGGVYTTNDLSITVANIGNAAIGNIAAIGSSGSPSVPILSVAGRTGAVVLTTNDIVGLNTVYATKANLTTANVGMQGYVDSKITANIALLVNSAPTVLDTIRELADAIGDDPNFAVNIALSISSANTAIKDYVDGQIIAANAGVTAANLGMKGYVDSIAGGISNFSNVNVKAYTESMGFQNFSNVNVAAYVTTANSAIVGYIDQANTIQSQQIASANIGIIGYIDQANTIQSAQVNAANLAITAANLGMKGYVDSVASQSIYGNGNVKSYLTEFDGNIVPSANVTYSLGNVTNRWKDLYLSGNTIFLGDATITTEGSRLVTTGVAISPPTGAVGFANVQFEAATNFDQMRSYYVDNNFGYTANLTSWTTAPIVWDELRSAKIKINSSIVAGSTPDFSSLDTSGGRFANAVATLDATGNIASLTITDGGVGYDAYYPYYATDPTGYDNNYIGQPFNSGSPTGKSFRRIGLIPTNANNVGNITSIGSFTRYSDLPTVGTNSYTWTGNTGTTISFTVDWASNTVTAYTYTPALPALTSAQDWQNWILDYQSTNDYGWIVGSGSITGGGGSPIQAVYDYLNREALPNSLTYDQSATTWYPGNLLINNSSTTATLSSSTFFVTFNRTAIGYATLENSYGNPVYWSRGLSADTGISSGGDMTVAGDLRVTGDLYVSPDSIYLGDLQLSSSSGNLVVHGNVSTGIVKTGVYTVSNLPSASTVGAGARAFVTDANTVVFGSALIGGEANAIPVFSNGTNWRVG